MPEPTPIRPGTTVRSERAVYLIEHVAKMLTELPELHDGEEPVDIVIVLQGAAGTMQPGWMIEGRVCATLALAGALLLREATD